MLVIAKHGVRGALLGLLVAATLACTESSEPPMLAVAGAGPPPVAAGQSLETLVVFRTSQAPCASFALVMGPTFEASGRRLRSYGMVASAPHVNVTRHVSHGTVEPDAAHAIGFGMDQVKVRIRPMDGKTWDAVRAESDLIIEGVDVLVF